MNDDHESTSMQIETGHSNLLNYHEKKALCSFIERITEHNIKSITDDPATIFYTISGLQKILKFLSFMGFGKFPDDDQEPTF